MQIIDGFWPYIIAALLCLAALVGTVAVIRHRRQSVGRRRMSAALRGQFEYIDSMDGVQFEHFIASLLERLGYGSVDITSGSHDQGVDVLAERDGVRFAVQCKHYLAPLGNTAVQEVTAGREYYRCHVGVVVTNSHFTQSARELAAANRILLWDRDLIADMLENIGF